MMIAVVTYARNYFNLHEGVPRWMDGHEIVDENAYSTNE